MQRSKIIADHHAMHGRVFLLLPQADMLPEIKQRQYRVVTPRLLIDYFLSNLFFTCMCTLPALDLFNPSSRRSQWAPGRGEFWEICMMPLDASQQPRTGQILLHAAEQDCSLLAFGCEFHKTTWGFLRQTGQLNSGTGSNVSYGTGQKQLRGRLFTGQEFYSFPLQQ